MTVASADVRATSDLELLQGEWTSIAGRRSAKLVFSGDRFAFAFRDREHESYSGCFLIDTAPNPKQMDMRIEDGPPAHVGQLALCIYRLESDLLRWCPSKPGAGYRFTAFPDVDDVGFLSLVFKHDHPRRNQ
jgi:uncharacterized protein (TIGR03067 family)